jgi:arylformamidase
MSLTPLYRQFTAQEQIDAEYNPALGLADPAQYARHYIEASRAAREQLQGVLKVPYGPTLDETLDIFPAAQAGAPVYVFLHGGYWRAFSAQDFSCAALGPCAAGFTSVVVNYQLAPRASLDEITRQVRAALAWVVRHIEAHNGDPSRIVIAGHSAGAHLAAMAMQTRWAEDYGLPQDPFRAALLVSGLYDLQPLRYSWLQPLIQLDGDVIRRCSPLFGARPCTTPVLITWGEQESAEFARQSTTFHEAWTGRGTAAFARRPSLHGDLWPGRRTQSAVPVVVEGCPE